MFTTDILFRQSDATTSLALAAHLDEEEVCDKKRVVESISDLYVDESRCQAQHIRARYCGYRQATCDLMISYNQRRWINICTSCQLFPSLIGAARSIQVESKKGEEKDINRECESLESGAATYRSSSLVFQRNSRFWPRSVILKLRHSSSSVYRSAWCWANPTHVLAILWLLRCNIKRSFSPGTRAERRAAYTIRISHFQVLLGRGEKSMR